MTIPDNKLIMISILEISRNNKALKMISNFLNEWIAIYFMLIFEVLLPDISFHGGFMFDLEIKVVKERRGNRRRLDFSTVV